MAPYNDHESMNLTQGEWLTLMRDSNEILFAGLGDDLWRNPSFASQATDYLAANDNGPVTPTLFAAPENNEKG